MSATSKCAFKLALLASLTLVSQAAGLNAPVASADEPLRDAYCGERAAHAALNWYGRRVALETIIEKHRSLHRDDSVYGSSFADIQSTLSAHGIDTTAVEISSSALVRLLTLWKRPAIIHLSGTNYAKGHFIAAFPGKSANQISISGLNDTKSATWQGVVESFSGKVLLTSNAPITDKEIQNTLVTDSSVVLRELALHSSVVVAIGAGIWLLWHSFHSKKEASVCSTKR